MNQPDRHLHVAGEVHPDCAGCLAKDDVIRGLERDLNGWRWRYADLKRDKQAEAAKHPLWPDAKRLFDFWRERTGRRRSGWDMERFDLVRPFLKKHGLAMCERAIVGKCFDPFVTERKNGTRHVHNEWHLIFGTADKFEAACNAAPLDFESALEAEDEARAVELAPGQRELDV